MTVEANLSLSFDLKLTKEQSPQSHSITGILHNSSEQIGLDSKTSGKASNPSISALLLLLLSLLSLSSLSLLFLFLFLLLFFLFLLLLIVDC